MASTGVVSVTKSATKRWALYFPFAAAVLAAVHLIPGVPPSAIHWIDIILGLFGSGVATNGVTVGLRNAISKNGTGQ
jgi:hypothetical protein